MLLDASQESDDVAGTQKAIPMDELDNGAVTRCELHRGNCGNAFETGKMERFHYGTVTQFKQAKKP
jgi:hypothetical protein